MTRPARARGFFTKSPGALRNRFAGAFDGDPGRGMKVNLCRE